MDAVELALRKCLHGLVSSSTITERKRTVETFVDLLKDNRTHELLDHENIDENTAKRSVTWNEMFIVIREYTINELSSIRTKSGKTPSPDIKYQEALKLFKVFIENSNIRSPQLDSRSLLESILSIITSEAWSSCTIVIKELSHLFIHNVLCFHKYTNEIQEQEWIDLCELYMALSKSQEKLARESDQAVYSSYLKLVVEKLVVYNDLYSNKSSIRESLFEFLRNEIEQIKNSNHFSVIENFICSLNSWAWKYLFDMPEEVLKLGNEPLASLIDIWRRKCSDKPKTEIIKFSRLQMSLHHPYQRKNIFEIYANSWIKNLRDINDLLLREIDEICHKQRSNNRQNQNEFSIRFDLLHLASSVFYQLSLNEFLIQNEDANDDEDFFEPSAKRTRYETSMPSTANTDTQMKSFQNLFQSIDSHHQAAGFQIVSLQLQRNMKLPKTDCDYYVSVIKRYLTDERRPSLLLNALRCLHLLLTSTSHCQLTSDLNLLIHPLIHIPTCESYVIEILTIQNFSFSHLCSCSSVISPKYIFDYLISHPNTQYSPEEENKLLDKLIPDLIPFYRNNEHDSSIFFSSVSSPEHTHQYASILMQLCSFDTLPSQSSENKQNSISNEFDQIEFEWSRLKLLNQIAEKDEETSLDFCSKINTCELRLSLFKRIIDIYGSNIRFIQQLKDKHLGERSKQILHFAFLGIYMLDILRKYFVTTIHDNEYVIQLIENTQAISLELTDETNFFYSKNEDIPFINDLLKHTENCIYLRSSSSSLLKPVLPSLNQRPSILFGFLDAKFLSYLYNFATQEIFSKQPSDIEGIQCPIDNEIKSRSLLIQSFEVLLLLCFQASHDQEYSSDSFSFNSEKTRNLLILILDEKLYLYLEELPLPSPISYQYLHQLFSHICSDDLKYSLNLRSSDFEFLITLFSQIFCVYRRDLRLCERFLHYFQRFLRRFYSKFREYFLSHASWMHLNKLIDAFWQMTLNRNTSLNNQIRKSLIQIKQILIQDEEIELHDAHLIVNDPSYHVRLEAYRFTCQLFYEKSGLVYLKSSADQEKLYQDFLQTNPSSVLLFSYLSNISEYLSRQVSFHFVQLAMKKKLSTSLLQHILSNISIPSMIQSWHQQTSYPIKDFPWDLFNIDSMEEYKPFLFSTYFFSSPTDRQQLSAVFKDIKSSVIEYFPELQASSLPLLANQKEDYRQMIEKVISKTEYNRLMKQKLTSIIRRLLFTFKNSRESEFYDKWMPEPILPAHTWSTIRNTFDYIKHSLNAKSFVELLIKSGDIGEILLCLSSNIISHNSLHEQLRLLNVFSLFLTDILLNSLDNDYLHSILRDSIYILLRYIVKNSQEKFLEVYKQELNDQILNLTCQLLHRLCQKGLDFDSSIYLQHIPDIVSILINYDQHLTRERIQIILIDIYQSIRSNNDPILLFISYAIEKLGYLSNETKRNSRPITTFHYFSYLSLRRSSLPWEWTLEMFHQHLDKEKKTSSSLDINPSMILTVKKQLLQCLACKSNHILAGKCLSKCPYFFLDENQQPSEEEDQYEPVPISILHDLVQFYLIDTDQSIVQCTHNTLKTLLNHSIGQELYQKSLPNHLIEIYSQPFLSQSHSSKPTMTTKFTSSANPWLIPSDCSFRIWFISLVNYLLQQIEYYYLEKNESGHSYAFLFVQLRPLIQLKIDLAKKIFPHLIHCLLLLPNSFNQRQILTENLTFLLEQLLGNKSDQKEMFAQIGKIFFRTMNYLRQCPIEHVNKRNTGKNVILNFQNHFWLDLDYFQLAKCASKYQSYQSAIIYTDIWTTKQRSILPENDYLTHLYYSDIDLLSQSSDLIDLYVRTHSNINQADDFYGLDKCFQNRSNLHGEFNQLNHNYYDSLFYYDQAALTIDSSKLIQSLRLCGFNHILEQYLKQVSSVSDQIFYRIQLTSVLTEQNQLTEWKVLHEPSTNDIRGNILSIIQRQMRVSSSSIPQLIDHDLWSKVSDLRECCLVNVIDDLTTNFSTPQVLSQIWTNPCNNHINENLFDQNDEILLTRVATTKKLLLHKIEEDEESQHTKQTLLADLITQLCQNALDSKKLQLCDRYLSDLSPLITSSYSHELKFLRAKVLVLRQQDTAGEYLRQLIDSPLPTSIDIRCRLLLCDWLHETRCETTSTIKQQLDSISTSIRNLDTSSSLSLIFESYLAMARFSDNEYQRLNHLFHSPIFENKRSLIARNQIEYTKQDKLDPSGRYTKVLKRSLDMDKKEIDEQTKLQYTYLISTLNNYLICLKFFSNLSKRQQLNNSITKNNSVPEIMITSKCLSYWFTNFNNEEVNKTLKKYLSHISTHFFLPFVYQMAARMALTTDKLPLTFHSILLEYLSRCIIDHPHHVLPVIFALANAHKDANIHQQTSATTTDKRKTLTEVIQLNNEINNDPRSRAARYLLEQCTKIKPNLVDQMRKLNDAYIEAAYWDVASTKTDPTDKNPLFSKQLRLMRIKDFHEVAVPTITIPVATDGVYKDIETVQHFNPEYSMVGGVNAPKKISCYSSNGRQLPQLLKGKDDLRQDAVMQQLFNVVNRLLDKDDLTAHRALNIRTYKVVPLTQKSGVLEWCEGTITFGDYLTKDSDGAHSRYHPEDWKVMDCRRHIHKATNTGKDERKRAFVQTCSKLKPVFRYFFYEYFNQPSVWHKKKQAYAKSIATSSIVGYIVGLGDRHVQNILIDTQTAEFIHIDLGVAFDQGKMLPIPETIPFRLTRDVIDGLGICGTEGLFKKSCEITLELMREYADTLITIIEVFLYDPLYQWQLSPQKALQLQQQFDKSNADSVAMSSGKSSILPSTASSSSASSSTVGGDLVTTDTNKMAERLLLGLRQKLQGVERLNQMTIKAHVNMLIQEATSIENLSQLFAGWQSYL